MNVVAIRPQPVVARNMRASDRRIARVEIFVDLTAAEPHWRALELGDSLATPYQRYDFLKHWQRHVGSNAGITPFIVVAFNPDGEPLFLLPLGSRPVGGLLGLEFLGGKHANFNMALWRRDVAATIGAAGLRGALAALSGHADVLRLINQPLTWGGATNPFALLPHQRAANYGFSGALVPDFDALLRARTNSDTRKKMRKKERALASFGELRFERATEPDDVRRVLDAFFKQKSARTRALGMSDAFSLPGVRRFIEAAATEQLNDAKPLIELYALSVDDIIVATMGGIVGGGRFCAMFNSIIQGRFAIESPGEQLILRLVRSCCERELLTFDLGIGEARYKNLLCGDAEPLFDSYIPLSPAGRLPALAFAVSAAAKRAIKNRPALWTLVGSMRRLRARVSSAP
ncbi:MAG TPA: GNAT family N-acetyltransferase [Pseudolabrys sp.]|nr:GNAT family N-acetyltransferase [Pseudolabrys sp.]